jgi:hypothetical protein
MRGAETDEDLSDAVRRLQRQWRNGHTIHYRPFSVGDQSIDEMLPPTYPTAWRLSLATLRRTRMNSDRRAAGEDQPESKFWDACKRRSMHCVATSIRILAFFTTIASFVRPTHVPEWTVPWWWAENGSWPSAGTIKRALSKFLQLCAITPEQLEETTPAECSWTRANEGRNYTRAHFFLVAIDWDRLRTLERSRKPSTELARQEETD